MIKEGKNLYDGELFCKFDDKEKIIDITDYMRKFHKVRDCEIISETEALEELKQGNFAYYRYNNPKVKKLSVRKVSIDYALDSKGYYQPVYIFGTKIDGEDYDIQIPALK